MKGLEPIYMKKFKELNIFNQEKTQGPRISLSSNILCGRGNCYVMHVSRGSPKPN